MIDQPLVSIIMPCFNQGMYINEAIQSVLNSSYPEIEIIVVNDGSTDANTNDILTNSKWDNTLIFNIKNVGVAGARNFAIEKSHGKYILPLDADDKISPYYIQDAVNILNEKPGVKIVCCEVEMFGAKSGKFSLPDPSIEMLLGQNAMVVTSMFRREDFDKTMGFNKNMSNGFEDWDFWLSMLESGGEAYKLNSVGFYYRMRHNSRNSSIKITQFSELRRQLFDNHRGLYANYFFDPTKSFEYESIKVSKEYRIGNVLLTPIRFIYNIFK